MSAKQALRKYATTFHKWLGLIIGIQVVLWITGGLVMSWFDIERVRSEHNIAEQETIVFTQQFPLMGIDMLLTQVGAPVAEVKLTSLVDFPVYQVTLETGEVDLYHAIVGQKLTPLPGEAAVVIADANFAPEAAPSEAIWVEQATSEYRGDLPVWRVDMNDEEETSIYVSPSTGEVKARRSDVWRVYDFFWMLHIMDYENRTDFNHPLIVLAAMLATILSLTGIVLLFFHFKKKDFMFLSKGK